MTSYYTCNVSRCLSLTGQDGDYGITLVLWHVRFIGIGRYVTTERF